MKERIKHNIDQYEQEIKIKEEINQREVTTFNQYNVVVQKDNLQEQVRAQSEETEKLKKEFAMKEKQLVERIKQMEKMQKHSNEYMMNQQQTVTLGGNSQHTQASTQY